MSCCGPAVPICTGPSQRKADALWAAKHTAHVMTTEEPPTLGPAMRFPPGLTGILWMAKQREAETSGRLPLVFGGGRRSFTLVHMWRRIPERRSVKCERTLFSSILQIAESIIRALTHTDGGSGPNGNRRNSGVGWCTEFSKYICNDFSTYITLSNIEYLLIFMILIFH